MSSINTITVSVPDMVVPVLAGEKPAVTDKMNPARSRKGRSLAAAAPALASTEQAAITVDGGKATGLKSATSGVSKTEIVLKKLRSAKGATIAQLGEATGWQAHSVRGFLSGIVRKKLGLPLSSEISRDGLRRYRITDNL